MDDTSPEVAAMVADRYLVGIDIDHASRKSTLKSSSSAGFGAKLNRGRRSRTGADSRSARVINGHRPPLAETSESLQHREEGLRS
jgi:hypothetical protein